MAYELTVPAELTAVQAALGLQLLQVVYIENRAWGSTPIAAVPLDDTLPTSTEMNLEMLTQVFTPRRATSKLIITLTAQVYAAAAALSALGLFKDAGTSPLDLRMVTVGAGGWMNQSLTFTEASGSITARTYRHKIGAVSNIIYTNGNNASRQFGGSLASTMTILEVQDAS